MRKSVFFAFLLFSILFPFSSFSQTQGYLGKRFFSNWSISISGGPNIFFGDLKVNSFWPVDKNMNEWCFGGSFSLVRQFSHVFALRGQVLYSEISGTKRNNKDGTPANVYFIGNILEYNLNMTVNLSNLFFRYKPQRKFFVYGTLGAGMSTWMTKKKDLITHQPIDSSGTPSNWAKEFAVLGGLGAYYSFADKVNLGLEWTLHGVNSDLLDVTSGGFQYDMYSFFALTLTYNFNKRNPAILKSAQYSTPDGIKLPPPPGKGKQPAVPPKKEVTDSIPPAPPTMVYPESVKVFPDSMKTLKPEKMPEPDTSLKKVAEPVVLGISYRVQIFSIKKDIYSAEKVQKRLKVSMSVSKEFTEGWYRFTVGSFSSFKDAKSLMKKLRAQRVRGAFVAKYQNGERIPARHRK